MCIENQNQIQFKFDLETSAYFSKNEYKKNFFKFFFFKLLLNELKDFFGYIFFIFVFTKIIFFFLIN
jgi:hypothetical protein